MAATTATVAVTGAVTAAMFECLTVCVRGRARVRVCVCVFSVSGLPSTPIHSFGVYFFAVVIVVATVIVAVAAQCVCTVVTAAI